MYLKLPKACPIRRRDRVNIENYITKTLYTQELAVLSSSKYWIRKAIGF